MSSRARRCQFISMRCHHKPKLLGGTKSGPDIGRCHSGGRNLAALERHRFPATGDQGAIDSSISDEVVRFRSNEASTSRSYCNQTNHRSPLPSVRLATRAGVNSGPAFRWLPSAGRSNFAASSQRAARLLSLSSIVERSPRANCCLGLLLTLLLVTFASGWPQAHCLNQQVPRRSNFSQQLSVWRPEEKPLIGLSSPSVGHTIKALAPISPAQPSTQNYHVSASSSSPIVTGDTLGQVQVQPGAVSSALDTRLAPVASSQSPVDTMMVAASKKKKKMKKMKKKEKKMEKKHKEWKKGKKHKKKKYESKKKKGGMSKKKKGKKEKKKWGMEKKGHKKKGNFKKKKWGSKKKMKKGHKKGKKGHKMLKDKGHKKKGFKKIYHKEEWGKKKKWHDIKREKKWNTKQKKWKKKWHQEKGKKYKGKHMKKYHKKNKHGKKYKKEKKSKWKKHKGEKFKKGHKKKKEEFSKKKEGGKKKKMKKMKKEMKKKKKG